ncbi:MAG: phage antirepressor N-terminal domain-containing protein [Victivallales bacterium]
MNKDPEMTALQIRHEPDKDVDDCRKLFSDRIVALPAVYVDGVPFVPLRPLCIGLGVDPKDQRNKLRTDPRFTCMDITSVGADGRKRKMFAIAAKQAYAWLSSINSRKVKPAMQQKLLEYQERVMDAIYEYTTKGYAINPEIFDVQSYKDLHAQINAVLAETADIQAMADSLLAKTYQLDSYGHKGRRQFPADGPSQLASG